jgi:hypothetical protein
MSFKKRTGAAAMPPAGFELMLSRFSDSPLLSDMRSALVKAVAEYAAAHEAVGRISGDKTLTDGGRLVRQATVTRSKMTAALAALDAARGKTAIGRKANEAALHKPLDFSSSNLADIALASETRAHFKSLPLADRGKFVLAAVNDLDLNTLRAIASVPAFLSGVSPQLHELARDKILSVAAPEPLANSKVLAEGEEFAAQLADQISQATANLVDFESADAIAKNAAV